MWSRGAARRLGPTKELRDVRHEVRGQRARPRWQVGDDALELRLLRAEETDSLCETPSVTAIADEHLVLAVGVVADPRDHAVLEQELLHLTARVARSGSSTTPGRRCGPSTEHEPSPVKRARRNAILVAEEPVPDELGHVLVSAAVADHRGENARPQGREVLDVELEELRPGLDRPLVDVPRSADDRVVRGKDDVEEVLVDVVETGSLARHEALGDESAGQGRRLDQRCRRRARRPGCVGARRTCLARSRSSSRQSSIGRPSTWTRHSTGWLSVPVSSKPSRVRICRVGWSPEWKSFDAWTGVPLRSTTLRSMSLSLFGRASGTRSRDRGRNHARRS